MNVLRALPYTGTYEFLLISQVVLALQLPLTLAPLIKATSSRRLMGPFRAGWATTAAAWAATIVIFTANLLLFASEVLPGGGAPGMPDKGAPSPRCPLAAVSHRRRLLRFRQPTRGPPSHPP